MLLFLTSQSRADRLISPEIHFTEAEKAWLAQHHTVRARVSNWPPFMLVEPEHSGMSVEYLKVISGYAEFKVKLITDDIGWPDSLLDLAEDRKYFDLILTMKRTPERESKYAITKDYIFYPWVIITRSDSDFIGNVNDLKGKVEA